MTWSIQQGDVLDRLREMPDESVQCCVARDPMAPVEVAPGMTQPSLFGDAAP